MNEPAAEPRPFAVAANAPAAWLFCFECGYVLRDTNVDDACPGCGLAMSASMRSSFVWGYGVKFATELQSGLFMLACSLLIIPAVPLLLAIVVATGSTPLLLISPVLLLGGEYTLWMRGVWNVTGFSYAHRDMRRTAQIARGAAAACGIAAGIFLWSLLVVLVNFWQLQDGWWMLLVLSLLMMLVARVVSLLAGSRALAVVLRMLTCRRTATMLYMASGFGIAAAILFGLGVVYWSLEISKTLPNQSMKEIASYIFYAAKASVWLAGLTGGVTCIFAMRNVNKKLRALKDAGV